MLWAVFFILLIPLVFLSHENNWAKIIFTVLCVIEVIFTAKIIPSAWNALLQAPEFKEKISKKLTWQIVGLILLNLIISSSFIIWMWAQSGKTIRILFGIILFLGFSIIKILFYLKYRALNKHIKTINIDCELIIEEESIEITPKEPNSNVYLQQNTKNFAKLENKKIKK